MKGYTLPLILLGLWLLSGCKENATNPLHAFEPGDPRLEWRGRTVDDTSHMKYLIGSASSLQFRYSGEKCKIWVKNLSSGGGYNYISLVVDHFRLPRIPVRFDTPTPIEIVPPKSAAYHDVELYKETEAANGQVMISRIEAEGLMARELDYQRKIEFIGNSITVGMGADTSAVPCGKGAWFDQHDAYDAYGPRVARALGLEYMVTGVTGIGVYRNWNTDHPVIGELYESTLLMLDPNLPQWDFNSFAPDFVSICLGTNDYSDGDGVKPRLPFDSGRFVDAYVNFIKMIIGHHPKTQIIITSMPVLGDEKNKSLHQNLATIKSKAEASLPGIKPIGLFEFSLNKGNGCGGHPSVAEHAKMADEMIAFLVPYMRD